MFTIAINNTSNYSDLSRFFLSRFPWSRFNLSRFLLVPLQSVPLSSFPLPFPSIPFPSVPLPSTCFSPSRFLPSHFPSSRSPLSHFRRHVSLCPTSSIMLFSVPLPSAPLFTVPLPPSRFFPSSFSPFLFPPFGPKDTLPPIRQPTTPPLPTRPILQPVSHYISSRQYIIICGLILKHNLHINIQLPLTKCVGKQQQDLVSDAHLPQYIICKT